MRSKQISHSCPDFDAAIDAIESARKINTALRDALDDEESQREELEKDLAEIKKELASAESEIADLQDEVRRLESILSETVAA